MHRIARQGILLCDTLLTWDNHRDATPFRQAIVWLGLCRCRAVGQGHKALRTWLASICGQAHRYSWRRFSDAYSKRLCFKLLQVEKQEASVGSSVFLWKWKEATIKIEWNGVGVSINGNKSATGPGNIMAHRWEWSDWGLHLHNRMSWHSLRCQVFDNWFCRC